MDNKVHEVDIDFDVDSDLPSEFSEDELNDEALAVHEADRESVVRAPLTPDLLQCSPIPTKSLTV